MDVKSTIVEDLSTEQGKMLDERSTGRRVYRLPHGIVISFAFEGYLNRLCVRVTGRRLYLFCLYYLYLSYLYFFYYYDFLFWN